MGDISDNISGVGGIGERGAIELVRKFGSVTNFLNRYIEGEFSDEKLPAKLKDFAESAEKQSLFRRNMDLMDLLSDKIPEPEGLKITKGELNQEEFLKLCDQFAFKKIRDNIDDWLAPFKELSK
jgi:5'-3' exonuclease